MQVNVNTTLTVLLLIMPNLLLAEHNYVIHNYTIVGDLLRTNVGEYKGGLDKERLCGKLPRELKDKVNGNFLVTKKDGSSTRRSFTDKEYVELAGDVPAFGVSGINYVYVRELKRQVNQIEYFDISQHIMIGNWRVPVDEYPDELYNFPIICGDRVGMKAKEEERIKNAPNRDSFIKLAKELQDDSKPIEKNRVYYSFFLDFIYDYSYNCKHLIRDGIVRTKTHSTVDSSGYTVGISTKAEITIQRGYIKAYERNRCLYKGSGGWINTFITPADLFSAGCKSKRVQKVYKRLYELEH